MDLVIYVLESGPTVGSGWSRGTTARFETDGVPVNEGQFVENKI